MSGFTLEGHTMAKASVGAKNKAAAAIRDAEVLDSVNGLSMDSVTSSVAATQVEVQQSLATLSGKLTEQLQVLQNIEAAINLKRSSLKQLHGIEATAVELDDLNAQIAAQKQSWEEEQAAAKRRFGELESERKKVWARQEEEYSYKLAQEHRKLEDAFSQRMAQMEKDNRERYEALEKGWTERETELKKRETELSDLRQQVANFPEVVKKEVNAAVAIATNSVKKEYETKMVLSAKDAETAAKLATQDLASNTASITRMQSQIEDLKTQLEQAHRDVKEISAKALDSASGRSAMEALQKVLEKEQTYKPGK
jgi:colicin import membrane protein